MSHPLCHVPNVVQRDGQKAGLVPAQVPGPAPRNYAAEDRPSAPATVPEAQVAHGFPFPVVQFFTVAQHRAQRQTTFQRLSTDRQRHAVALEVAQGIIDRQHILVGQPFPWPGLTIPPEGVMQR